MSLYSTCIFPRLLDWGLDNEGFGGYRRAALAEARGATLEVGFGTGLNLPYYPPAVTHLVALDSVRALPRRVRARIAAAPMPVEQIQLDATGRLPFANASFETVVTTLTLCSLEDPAPALDEMRRVLRPGGRYLFFEHGRSADRRIARWQDHLNPLQRLVAAGCRLDREIDRLIAAAGFKFIALDRFLMPHTPRVLSTIYRGVATPV